jgi:hypothetical protein
MRPRRHLLALLVLSLTLARAWAAQTSILDHGAAADTGKDNASAIQRAIDKVAESGGGTVFVPSGRFVTGPLRLRSRITLHLEPGAVLQASPRLEDYPKEARSSSGESERPGLLTTQTATEVAITGRGTIDGSALAFVFTNQWKPLGGVGTRKLTRQGEDFMSPKFGTEHGPFAHSGDRPGNLVHFLGCTNVLISGVTIQNSPTWTVQIRDCGQVKILGVNINSRASDQRIPNDDGIDLVNSRHVQIADCDIQTGDDCIALFGSQFVTVNNCILQARSSAIRVGYDEGDTRHCVFSNLAIHDANRGLGVFVRGTGSVEHILFNGIVMTTRFYTGDWWGKAEPIHVSAVPFAEHGKPLGTIRNVRFQNVTATSESGILIYGTKESPITELSLENVHLTVRSGPLSQSYGGNFDLRSADRDERALFKHDIAGLYAQQVDGLTVRDFRLSWQGELPDFFTDCLRVEHFNDVLIEGFRGRQAPSSKPGSALALSQGSGVSVRDCTAAEGTGLFLRADAVKGRLFVNNDLSRARTASEPKEMPFQAANNLLPQP